MHLKQFKVGKNFLWECNRLDCSPDFPSQKRKDSPVLASNVIDELVKRHKKLPAADVFVEPVCLPSEPIYRAQSSNYHAPAPPANYLEAIMAQMQKNQDYMVRMEERWSEKFERVLQADPVPVAVPKTFSEEFKEEPLDKTSLLESLKSNFPRITEVYDDDVFRGLSYDFSAKPSGYWQ